MDRLDFWMLVGFGFVCFFVLFFVEVSFIFFPMIYFLLSLADTLPDLCQRQHHSLAGQPFCHPERLRDWRTPELQALSLGHQHVTRIQATPPQQISIYWVYETWGQHYRLLSTSVPHSQKINKTKQTNINIFRLHVFSSRTVNLNLMQEPLSLQLLNRFGFCVGAELFIPRDQLT